MKDYLEAFKYNQQINGTFKKLCAPLLDLGITSLTHSRYLKNGKMLRIASDAEWSEIYFKNNFHSHPEGYHASIEQVCSGFSDLNITLWSGRPNTEIYKILANYGIWNGITLCTKDQDSLEGWSFGSTLDNDEIINFYLANLQLLKNFVLYMKDKAKDILDVTDTDKLFSYNLGGYAENLDLTRKLIEFSKTTQAERFYLDKSNKTYITKREFEVLCQLSRGKSFKEVGLVLGISHRSIEAHMDNIKTKYNLHKKSEVLKLFFNGLNAWI